MSKVVGILNLTPDSFHDGGRLQNWSLIQAKVESMVAAGVDIIDIGCESTNPKSKRITLEEEMSRLEPYLSKIRQLTTTPLAIDTYKTEVMAFAIDEGIDMINDQYALRSPGAIELVAKANLPVCLMHFHGTLATMHEQPHFEDVMVELETFFTGRIEACLAHGIKPKHIVLDPGIGFSKTHEENLTVLREIEALKTLGYPIYIGASRKRFIGKVLALPDTDDRLIGSIAVAIKAWQAGAEYIRTHDVAETKQALDMMQALTKIRTIV